MFSEVVIPIQTNMRLKMCSCVKKPYAVLKFCPSCYTDAREIMTWGIFNFISNVLPSLLVVVPETGEVCVAIGRVA